MVGNLFWGMQFRTCKNFWDFADSKSSLNPQNSHKYKSHTAITSIVVALATNLKIKCESIKKFLLLFAFAKSRIPLFFCHCEANHRFAEAIQKNQSARSANLCKSFCYFWLLPKVESLYFSVIARRIIDSPKQSTIKSFSRITILILALTTQITPLSANESFAPNNNHGITILTENDAYFEPLIKSDKYYTGGHYISYLSPEFADSWINKIAGFSHLYDKHFSRFSVALKQEIYTPDNKNRYDSIAPSDDLLFGAGLYANIAFVSRTRDFMEQFSLDIGVVGPLALGKETQNFIHRVTKNNAVWGWDVKSGALKNEILLNLHYGLIWRWVFIEDFFDVLPQFQISLGNAYTAASAGVKFRVGYGIKNDFGAQKLKSRFVQNIVGDGLKIYGVFGLSGSVVGRDMFVEGNTGKSAPKSPVTINRFLYEVEVGAMIGWKYLSFGYVWSNESPRFKEQPIHHKYGSIRLEIIF